jgi:hypothetical protein
VAVEAKLGLLRDRVFVDEREYEVLRGRRGVRAILDPLGPAGRVRYDGLRDRISIDSPHGVVEIRFRWRNTTFDWRGRSYRVGSMLRNRLTIWDGNRPALEAKITWTHHFILEIVAPEFREIERELAVGLGLRAMAVATAFVPLG